MELLILNNLFLIKKLLWISQLISRKSRSPLILEERAKIGMIIEKEAIIILMNF